MKTFTFLIVLSLVSAGANAQDTVKRFCQLSVNGRRIKLDYGQTNKYTPLKDSVYVNKLRKVESLSGLVGVLNYMSDLGWKYEWAIPDVNGVYGTTGTAVRVLFSKEFDRSQLVDQPLRTY